MNAATGRVAVGRRGVRRKLTSWPAMVTSVVAVHRAEDAQRLGQQELRPVTSS